MTKARLIVLSLLGVFAASAIAAASAAAVGCEEAGGEKCEWRVEKVVLAAKATKAYTAKAGNTFVMTGEVAGIKFELTSKELEAKNGSIEGGAPGKGKVSLDWKNVTVVKPAGCQIEKGELISKELQPDLAEDEATKKDLLEFTPTNGEEVFFETRFENKGAETCVLNKQVPKVKGRLLATPNPRNAEVKVMKWEFGNGAKIKKWRSAVGEKPKLVIGAAEVTFKGTAEVSLNPVEEFSTL